MASGGVPKNPPPKKSENSKENSKVAPTGGNSAWSAALDSYVLHPDAHKNEIVYRDGNCVVFFT